MSLLKPRYTEKMQQTVFFPSQRELLKRKRRARFRFIENVAVGGMLLAPILATLIQYDYLKPDDIDIAPTSIFWAGMAVYFVARLGRFGLDLFP